jgi:hypothetical protein
MMIRNTRGLETVGKLPKFVFLAVLMVPATAQMHSLGAPMDSDRDGLSDTLEDALLARFAPTLMVSRTDCSVVPAQFAPEVKTPTAIADDGTIYGQAFPQKGHSDIVELHYYHLWRRDCGQMGHALDAEHVSALIEVDGDADSAKALYWYAAAHEDTVCDASHLARASTMTAGDRGATVWISAGKHASFLSEEMCSHGCGGDRCEQIEKLQVRAIVNLGESQAPMQEITWLRSAQWPLKSKLERSDFEEARIERVNRAQQDAIVWATPSKRPAQATILGFNQGIGGAATGGLAADTALVIADSHTDAALDVATDKTRQSLKTSSSNTWKALKGSAQKVGDFLSGKPKK